MEEPRIKRQKAMTREHEDREKWFGKFDIQRIRCYVIKLSCG